MKRNIKSVILTVILAFAFALTACKFSDNNQQKTKKQNTNTPAGNPSSDIPEDTELGLDSSELPLTLEAITAGRIILSTIEAYERINIQKNNGLIVDVTNNIEVQPGDKIRFYGSNYKFIDADPYTLGTENLIISCTADCYVYGNVMSLLYHTNFKGKTQIPDKYAFQKLFLNNTHIKNHETLDIVLPATTLSVGCYKKMFYGCTGLTRAPELPAATLTADCYNSMFFGCVNLNSIKCLATEISASDCTKNWVCNVSTTGSFASSQNNNIWRIKDTNSGIPKGWTADPSYIIPNEREIPLTLQAIDNGSINLTNKLEFKNLKYSKNNGEKISAQDTINIEAGDIISFFAEGPENEDSTHLKIGCTSDCYIYGNIMSLLDPENFSTKTKIEKTYTFCQLFAGNEHIKNMSIELVLPATELAGSCYQSMFYQCTGITSAPALPATTLANYCYSQMFSGCTSLTAVPVLPATNLADSCYSSMFYGCTGLTTAPVLPATNLADLCYCSMFNGCTGLTTAPVLSATKLAVSCYSYMFYGCTGLTTAPVLPATNLADSCYSYMFYGCTGLTSAPALPATTLAKKCYDSMFSGCSNLKYPPVLPATNLKEYCYHWMFYNCKSLTNAPELPATTLAKHCYEYMFSNCSGLIFAPDLPATILADSCYENMFSYCGYLSYVKCLCPVIYLNNTYFSDWLSNTSLYGLLITDNYTDTSWRSIIPSNWQTHKDFPLIIEAIESCTITVKKSSEFDGMYYRKNFRTRTTLNSTSDITISVNAGEKVAFYANGKTGNLGMSSRIICNAPCYIYGNIMSLVDATGYDTKLELTIQCMFFGLFMDNTFIKNHPSIELSLPATTLTDSCYMYMFLGCENLTTAPVLPAATLKDDCYREMFYNCTNLSYVKCLATNISATNCCDKWLLNVSPKGTFVRAASMENWSTGESGIPEGWIVEDYVAP